MKTGTGNTKKAGEMGVCVNCTVRQCDQCKMAPAKPHTSALMLVSESMHQLAQQDCQDG